MSNVKVALVLSSLAVLAACGGDSVGVTPAAPYNYSQHTGTYICQLPNQGTANYNFEFTNRSVTVSGPTMGVIDQMVGFTPAGKPYYSAPYANDDNGMSYSQTVYISGNQLKIALGPTANVPNNLSDLGAEGLELVCDKTQPPV